MLSLFKYFISKSGFAIAVTRLFGVDIQEKITDESSILNIKGPINQLESATIYIREQYCFQANSKIPLSSSVAMNLQKDETSYFQSIRDELLVNNANVTLELKKDTSSDTTNTSNSTYAEISGPTEQVETAKLLFYRMLDMSFPGEFASVPMDHSCLTAFVVKGVETDIHENITELETGKNNDLILYPDVQFSCIRVMGSTNIVNMAVMLLRDWRKRWVESHARVDIETFMIPLLLGEKGKEIEKL